MNSDDQILQKPVIVLGAPRSGTSFLGRVLGKHRSLFYLREPRLTWSYANDAKSDMLRSQDARPAVVRHIRRTFAEQIRAAHKTRMLEKTPRNALRMAFIDQIFPDAIYIHILRSPIDTILSIRSAWERNAHGLKNMMPGRMRQRMGEVNLRRMPHYAGELLRRALPRSLGRRAVGHPVWGPRLPGLSQMVAEMDMLAIACIQWRTCVEAAVYHGRTLPPQRYREVRLDQVSSDMIRDLLAFAELDDDPAIFAYLDESFDAKRPSGRRKQVSSEDLATIRRWTHSPCAWLGEPLAAVGTPGVSE